jgi:hypothetical protein
MVTEETKMTERLMENILGRKIKLVFADLRHVAMQQIR